MDSFKILASYGYTTEELLQGASELSKTIPPFNENDIDMIRHNPSLSFFQKWKLIRNIKKYVH